MDMEQLKLIATEIDADIKAVFANIRHRSASGVVPLPDLSFKLVSAKVRFHLMVPVCGSLLALRPETRKPCGIGQVFESGGKPFKVMGLRGGKSQKSVVAELTWNHKRYVFHPRDVKRLLTAVVE